MMKLKEQAEAMNSLISAYNRNLSCDTCQQIRHLASQFQHKETEQMTQGYLDSLSCFECFERINNLQIKDSKTPTKNEKFFGFGSTIGMSPPSPPNNRLSDNENLISNENSGIIHYASNEITVKVNKQ